MVKKRKLGLFGGTFDPVHRGHLVMARVAVEWAGLSEMIFLPAAAPPHKRDHGGDPMASFSDRLAMVEIALAGMEGYRVSDVEGRRSPPSYTVDTLREFKAREGPETELHFLIGGDWIPGLASWKDIEVIFSLCRFLVVPRSGFLPSNIPGQARGLDKAWVARLQEGWIEAPEVVVSSTSIRERVSSGRSIGDLVPGGVENYIRDHGLYARQH